MLDILEGIIPRKFELQQCVCMFLPDMAAQIGTKYIMQVLRFCRSSNFKPKITSIGVELPIRSWSMKACGTFV